MICCFVCYFFPWKGLKSISQKYNPEYNKRKISIEMEEKPFDILCRSYSDESIEEEKEDIVFLTQLLIMKTLSYDQYTSINLKNFYVQFGSSYQ